jgi:hypothetical protein
MSSSLRDRSDYGHENRPRNNRGRFERRWNRPWKNPRTGIPVDTPVGPRRIVGGDAPVIGRGKVAPTAFGHVGHTWGDATGTVDRACGRFTVTV